MSKVVGQPGPRRSAVGRDAGRDTLFHREKPGEFGPRTAIRGGTGEAKSGARGGKRLAGRSGHFVSKGKLTHQVVDPPSRYGTRRTAGHYAVAAAVRGAVHSLTASGHGA